MEDAIQALPVMLDVFCIGSPSQGTGMELQIHVSNAGTKPGCPNWHVVLATLAAGCSAGTWCRQGSVGDAPLGQVKWSEGSLQGNIRAKHEEGFFPTQVGNCTWCAVLHPPKIPCYLSDGNEHYWSALEMLCQNSPNPKRQMLKSTLWSINDVTKRNKSQYASASPPHTHELSSSLLLPHNLFTLSILYS